ncbi:hypothetical protein [Porticoccus sp.]
MKPDASKAMRQLIRDVRRTIPFDMPAAQVCGGLCIGCPKKLLNYLADELDHWQSFLDDGHVPRLGDLSRLGRCSQKVYSALQKNQLV